MAKLVVSKTSGWRMNAKDVHGKPDFVFDRERLAIFVDGCFWHGCPRCRNIPATNRPFWKKKIEGNKLRDAIVSRKLRKDGWSVLRFWEHQLRLELEGCFAKIKKKLVK